MPTLKEMWVRHAPMPAEVQLSFCDDHPELVATRTDLDGTVWDHLLSSHSKNGDVVRGLAARELTEAQLLTLMSCKGLSVSVVHAALEHNLDKVSDDIVAARSKYGARSSKLLAELTTLSRETRYAAALNADATTLLMLLWEWIDPDTVDGRVLDMLISAEQWWPKRPSTVVHHLCAALFEMSPGVSDELCSDTNLLNKRTLLICAGSHSLTETAAQQLAPRISDLGTGERASFVQAAFIANPRVPIDLAREAAVSSSSLHVFNTRRNKRGDVHLDAPVQECTDLQLLNWVASRTVPSTYRPMGRPWNLPALVAAPAFRELGESHREAAASLVRDGAVPDLVGARCAELIGIEPEVPVHHDTPPPYVPHPQTVNLDVLKAHNTAHLCYERFELTATEVAARLGSDPTAWRMFIEFAGGSESTVNEVLDLVDACS